VSARAPFRRGRFETLPERPGRPHPYFDSEAHAVAVDSRPFGRVRIHYRAYGAGPPLLLVHGLMTSSYSWRYVLDGLGRRFRLYVPDLVGAGRSDKPTDRAYGAPALATFIGELQQALGLRGCAAVGNSLGGYLCMRRALDDPGAFARLANIHSPAFPEPRLRALGALLRLPPLRALVAWLARRDPERWAHRNVHYFDESLKSREEARAYGEPLSTPDGARAFARWLAEALAPRDLADFARSLARRRDAGQPFPVPLLLLYARQDPMVPPSTGARLHALVPSARFEWLADSSHFAHVDSPDRVVPLLLDFLGAAP
jgi:pimeloyl-ACP methyl ester carboxylesterase